MKNTLINILLRLIPTPKNGEGKDPRILVVSTTGLGDSIWGTPAIRALRKKHPNARIALLTSPVGKQVFLNNPNIDEIFVLKSPFVFSAFKLFSSLRKQKFNAAYIFHISQRIALPLVSLTGASKIVGTKGSNKGLDHLLTHPQDSIKIHEIERRLKIVDCAGAKADMELFVTEKENEKALEHLPNAPLVIGMHPGAKDRFKQWNPKYFIELGRLLAQEKGALILINGDLSEAKLCEEIANNIPRAVSLAGKLPLRPISALIEKLDFFITNDTGPMHIAFAMNTPTLALFSPTDPMLCGPYKTDATVLAKPKTCTPCLRKKCRSPFCMEQISPQEVYELISL
ncbi:MAG: glycosyltransferase family 9 protein [Simkaniaceae bacterium]|nr:glycosyltransferase family 9 protein [Simkaniaceae bacterium]